MESIDGMNPRQVSGLIGLTGGEDGLQIYAATGSVARSQLRILKHGLEVIGVANVELPGVGSAIRTIKLTSLKTYTVHTSS